MAFSEQQTKQLSAKLSPRHVRTREADGKMLAYIEGWHAIAEANRIFGFDAWDRETIAEKCVWSAKREQQFACAYAVKVRISVRAGDALIRREGTGCGEATGPTPGQAHELALKAAETDATKRALATFGNSFGLALYDKNHAGVRGGTNVVAEKGANADKAKAWPLCSDSGKVIGEFADATGFAQGLKEKLVGADDVGSLFDLWAHNLKGVMRLQQVCGNKDLHTASSELIALLKDRARELAERRATGESTTHGNNQAGRGNYGSRGVDKSALAIPEPKRKRCKAHLAYVARQPCLVCGRKPSHAHHIRYAQPVAMGRKVSDEYCVPVCALHHRELHAAGDEALWWQQRSIDPMAVARGLWKRT